ncbi:MAG TPA: glycosyltransferase family 1 protein, partial [Candidatus Omnitrophota bacterium]|nr:glycosyltransferase family 1 protein [Candidatus Omnitrophota bacterium]
MRIGFDARMINHPGIGRYIRCLLPEMFKLSPDDEFILLGNPVDLIAFSAYENVNVREWKAPIYSALEQFILPHLTKDIDLLHVPHFNIPMSYRGKLVVTIHDLIYMIFPDSLSSPVARWYARFLISSAVEKSERIIAVSEHTKKDIKKIFGPEQEKKIDVVYEAASSIFRRVEDKARIADVICRYRLSEQIILYVGSIKPHKNVSTLIEVFNLLKSWGVPHQLVICGKWDKKEDRLKFILSDRNIRYLGEVPTEDLIALYSMADILVHLSLYEGFGLTVLEAMQCGTPVVVSEVSALSEVAGDAAYAVHPKNVDNIADTIYNVLINRELRDKMAEFGLKHVRKFSWEFAANHTLETYRKTLGN